MKNYQGRRAHGMRQVRPRSHYLQGILPGQTRSSRRRKRGRGGMRTSVPLAYSEHRYSLSAARLGTVFSDHDDAPVETQQHQRSVRPGAVREESAARHYGNHRHAQYQLLSGSSSTGVAGPDEREGDTEIGRRRLPCSCCRIARSRRSVTTTIVDRRCSRAAAALTSCARSMAASSSGDNLCLKFLTVAAFARREGIQGISDIGASIAGLLTALITGLWGRRRRLRQWGCSALPAWLIPANSPVLEADHT